MISYDVTVCITVLITISGEYWDACHLCLLCFLATTNCSECHPNATCEDSSGQTQCVCNDGLIGDGFQCSDIDECAYPWTHNCSGACVNTYGSYTCECGYGLTKNSLDICVDIDECSDRNLSSCHSLANCTNYYGGYSCNCPYGYNGDGYHCEWNECMTGVCGKDMGCTKLKGDFNCFDPCNNYTELDNPWRSSDSGYGYNCDSYLSGWYRFIGTGGIRIPETCVSGWKCNTNAPMWINGIHPLERDGIVNLTSCAQWNGNCCYFSTNVQVKACPGGYHVYNINGVPSCSAAYCTGTGRSSWYTLISVVVKYSTDVILLCFRPSYNKRCMPLYRRWRMQNDFWGQHMCL